MTLYITWDIDPEIFHIGSLPVRWYGLLFALGFLIGVQVMTYLFKIEKKPPADLDALLITMVVSTIVGARLGHFLFYEPWMFVRDPLSIITPPFAGLASHGGIIGISLGLLIYARRLSSKATGQTFLWLADRICLTSALAGAFIRFGNLMNSEIVGTPTTVPWAFVFVQNHEFSPVPRHPAQLYESLSYLALFFGLFWFWKTYRRQAAPGTMLGISLIWVFGLRFVWEFFKENQEPFEAGMALNMGQLLSIPAVGLGLVLIVRNILRPSAVAPVALVLCSTGLCYRCNQVVATSQSAQVAANVTVQQSNVSTPQSLKGDQENQQQPNS